MYAAMAEHGCVHVSAFGRMCAFACPCCCLPTMCLPSKILGLAPASHRPLLALPTRGVATFLPPAHHPIRRRGRKIQCCLLHVSCIGLPCWGHVYEVRAQGYHLPQRVHAQGAPVELTMRDCAGDGDALHKVGGV